MRLSSLLAALEDVKGVIVRHGLRIKIENPRGSTRSGVNKKGEKWSTTMTYPYGELVDYPGVDGDPLDVFIGPQSSQLVHVAHIHKQDGSIDEDKVMMDFPDAPSAKQALLENYDTGWHFAGLDSMRLDEFKRKLKDLKTHPQILRAAQQKTFKVGDEVFIDGGHANKGMVRAVNGRRITVQLLSNLVLTRDVNHVHPWDESHISKSWVGNR